jgi:hypothetical protein
VARERRGWENWEKGGKVGFVDIIQWIVIDVFFVYVFRKEGGGYKPYIGYLDISVPTRRKKEKKRGCMRQLGCCWFDGVGSCAPLDKGTRGFESGTGTGTGILNIRE